MPITITQFNGVVLKGDLTRMPDSNAVACTALVRGGMAQPLRKMTSYALTVNESAQTLYYYAPTSEWLDYPQRLNAVRSPLVDDQYSRIYLSRSS